MELSPSGNLRFDFHPCETRLRAYNSRSEERNVPERFAVLVNRERNYRKSL